VLEQLDWINIELSSQTLKGSKSEIALTALKASEVGAVNAKDAREGFLRQAPPQSMGAQIQPYAPLKVAFHEDRLVPLLLDGLQTYK